MKSTFSLILVFLLSHSILFAQDNNTPQRSASRVSFGIKAGVNIANLDDNNEPNTESITGFHAGLLAHIHLNHKLALQPEVMYSRQGAWYPVFGTETINYIQVPVLVQYMYKGLRLQTGPQVGIITDAKLERDSGGETDIKYQLDNADFSWVIGLGYISPIGIGVDARYNLGLNNIAKQDEQMQKNRVWQFGLFYQFNR